MGAHHPVPNQLRDTGRLVDSLRNDVIHCQWRYLILLPNSLPPGLFLDHPNIRELAIVVASLRRYRIIDDHILRSGDPTQLCLEVLPSCEPAAKTCITDGLLEDGVVVGLSVEEG